MLYYNCNRNDFFSKLGSPNTELQLTSLQPIIYCFDSDFRTLYDSPRSKTKLVIAVRASARVAN
jgi:hypothetical protein